MKTLIFLVLLLSVGRNLLAQSSAYQDADSNSSIEFLAGGANLTLNVSDTKFAVGLLHRPDGQHQKTDPPGMRWKEGAVYGINFSGKSTSDLTNQIFQSGNSPASVGGGGVIGIHRLAAGLDKDQTTSTVFTDDWLFLNVNFTKSTFNTVPTGGSTTTAQHFNGFSVMPAYNFSLSVPGLIMLFGATGGVSRVNNSDQLKNVSINTTDSSSGNVSVVETQSAYMGDYAEDYNAPIYSDFVFVPNKTQWLSFDAFERANVLKTDQYAEGGFGIFVAQPKSPTKVLGGISVAWKNGKRTIGIVGGWSF